MISYLVWKVLELNPNNVVLLTSSGVWYDVSINEIVYNELSEGEEVTFFIHHHITEVSQALFGFLNKSEKKLFEELIKISWIWWKVAMLILTLWNNSLIEAVGLWDNKKIESIKWVWKKMAEKIILELKDKDFWIEVVNSKLVSSTWTTINLDNDLYESIKETLVAMWYNSKHIERALNSLPDWLDSPEQIIPYVIKNI